MKIRRIKRGRREEEGRREGEGVIINKEKNYIFWKYNYVISVVMLRVINTVMYTGKIKFWLIILAVFTSTNNVF